MSIITLLTEIAGQLSAETAEAVDKGAVQTAADVVSNLSTFSSSISPDNKAFEEFTKATTDEAGNLINEKGLTRNGPIAIVFTGFILHMAIEMWSFKPKLDFKPHLMRLVLYSVLLLSYGQFSQTISGFVMSLGAINSTSVIVDKKKATSFLASQKKKFDAAKKANEEDARKADELFNKLEKEKREREAAEKRAAGGGLDLGGDDGDQAAALAALSKTEATGPDLTDRALSAVGTAIGKSFEFAMYTMMALITEGSFLFAAMAIFFLKLMQSTMMSVILGLGPIMIAFGSWPGVTARYLSSWVSALIETAAWGIVAKVFIGLMVVNATKQKDGIEDANFFEYMGLNILYAASLLSVPAITSGILRGSAGSGVTAAGMMAATAGTAVSAAKTAAAAGGTAAKSGASAVMERMKGKGDAPPKESPRSADKAADTAYSPSPPPSGGGGAPSSDRDFHRNQGANAKREREKNDPST